MSTTKLSYETNKLASTVSMYDVTQKRPVVKPPDLPIFLAQIIRQEQDELAQAQARIEKLLQVWGKREGER